MNCSSCGKPNTELILRHGLCPPCLEAGYGAMREELVRIQGLLAKEATRYVYGTLGHMMFGSPAEAITKLLEQFPE